MLIRPVPVCCLPQTAPEGGRLTLPIDKPHHISAVAAVSGGGGIPYWLG